MTHQDKERTPESDDPIDIDPWRLKLLDTSSRLVAGLVLLWLALFIHRPQYEHARGSVLTIAAFLLLPCLPFLSYRLRATLLVLAFWVSLFVAGSTHGPAPAAIMGGISAIITAGLLFGVRAAVITWGLTAVGFAIALHLAGLDENLPVEILDPRNATNANRLTATYVLFSAAIAISVTVVANRLSNSARDARTEADHARKEKEKAVEAHRALEQTQNQMIEAQKFEVTARLSGGVAHDVNNSLQVLMGYAESLRDDAMDPEQLREIANEMTEVCQDSSELARQLLTLGKRVVLERRVVSLREEVTALFRAVKKIVPSTVRFESSVDGDAFVSVDLLQLKQSCLNLAINATHAMPEGGTLSMGFSEHGSEAHIEVSDTGQGMDPETLSKIFEPFFTTKGSDGTGLGLATVKAVAEQHGGSLEVESRVGKGTRFTMIFPTTDERPTTDSPTGGKTTDLDGIKVLVVDDEPRVLHAVSKMLRGRGAMVLQATTGDEALAVARATHQRALQ